MKEPTNPGISRIAVQFVIVLVIVYKTLLSQSPAMPAARKCFYSCFQHSQHRICLLLFLGSQVSSNERSAWWPVRWLTRSKTQSVCVPRVEESEIKSEIKSENESSTESECKINPEIIAETLAKEPAPYQTSSLFQLPAKQALPAVRSSHACALCFAMGALGLYVIRGLSGRALFFRQRDTSSFNEAACSFCGGQECWVVQCSVTRKCYCKRKAVMLRVCTRDVLRRALMKPSPTPQPVVLFWGQLTILPGKYDLWLGCLLSFCIVGSPFGCRFQISLALFWR